MKKWYKLLLVVMLVFTGAVGIFICKASTNKKVSYSESSESDSAYQIYLNVEDMKQAQGLKAGMVVETQGFYHPGDGGAGKYLVSDTVTEDYYYGNEQLIGGIVQQLDGGNYALLIPENGAVNVKQAGAVGDGQYVLKEDKSSSDFIKGHDDTAAFQDVFNICGFGCKWKIIIPEGNYCVDTIELAEGGCYNIEGVNSAGDPYNDISGHNCTIHSYGDNLFSGSFERRWKETEGDEIQNNYKRPTYVTVKMGSLEVVNESAYENAAVFSNIILRVSNINSNLIKNYATIFKGGFDWTTKIDSNYIVGIKKSFVGPTDLPCYEEWEQRAMIVDSYVQNNYINASPSSMAVVYNLGASGDMDFVNSSDNFYDFFQYLVKNDSVSYTNENGEDVKAHQQFSDASFNGDTFDYFVRMLGPGETIIGCEFVGCKFTHMSRDYISVMQATDNANEIWGPFVLDNAGMVNVVIDGSYVKACDGFFSCSKEPNVVMEEQASPITYLENVKISNTIFYDLQGAIIEDGMHNENIRFFYGVTDQFVENTNRRNFSCDDLEYQNYDELPVIYNEKNKTFYFYEGQHIIYKNRELRCDGNNWIDVQGNIVTQ